MSHDEGVLATKQARAAAFAAARTMIRAGDFAEAEARLRAVLDEDLAAVNRASGLTMLGDALDGQGRYPEAFSAYAAANRTLSRDVPAGRPAGETQLARALRLAAYFEAAPADWRRPPDRAPPGPAKTHVFLMGFPRSGTTLMELALAGHPEIVSLEEQPTLAAQEEVHLADAAALDRLAVLDEAETDRLRQVYWQRVRSALGADVEGKVFIDKLPLNTVRLPLIARLFPEAGILFAVRDPRDVVFSCFRRFFALNAAMREFLNLEDAAAFYAAVMRLAQACFSVLPIKTHRIRYEDLVADFEGEAGQALEFLGLGWDPEVAAFAARARERPVNTPSAPQVTRGLYKEGVGQWRAYEQEMAGVLPVLRPWIETYGYAESGSGLDPNVDHGRAGRRSVGQDSGQKL